MVDIMKGFKDDEAMNDVDVMDFPFVAELPKREKAAFVSQWELFRELAAKAKFTGVLVPPGFAAAVLGVSRQRVWELIQGERLEVVLVGEHRFISERSLVDYAQSERKAGRPAQLPEGAREMWKRSVKAAKEMVKEGKGRGK
jgi:hypothetical protein